MATTEGAPRNYLTAEAGAHVLEVSHESTQLGSAASNLLIDREDHLWIADRPPQHVSFALAGGQDSIRYIGWYVWHDYLTNPKTVDVFSGPSLDSQHHVMTCTAYPGSGVQLWELAEPIPRDHRVMTFKVMSTFGGSYTYMNRVYAFAEHPGSKFVSRHSIPRARTTGALEPRSPGMASDIGSPFHMSALLRDLDEDIRSLHPLKTNAQIPELSQPEISPGRDYSRVERSLHQQHAQHHHQQHETSAMPTLLPAGAINVSTAADALSLQRIASLESSVLNLIRVVETQSHEISSLRTQLALQAQQQQSSAVSVQHRDPLANFPEEALRNYVEDIMAPKLAKHTRRFEARVTQKMDEHLQELLRTVQSSVDEQVARHMRKVALSVDESYRHVARPKPSGGGVSSRRDAPTY